MVVLISLLQIDNRSAERLASHKRQEQFQNIVIVRLTDCCSSVMVDISRSYGYLLDWLIITRLVSSLLPLRKHQEQFLLLISHGQYFSMLWLDWLIQVDNIRLASGLILFTSIRNNFTALLLCPGCLTAAHQLWSIFLLDVMILLVSDWLIDTRLVSGFS